MKTIIITLLLAMAFVINSCSKDDENSLTAPTTNGSGTLSFLLDGKVWRPKTSFNFPNTIYSHALFVEPQFLDSTYNKLNEFVKISIVANRNDGKEDLEFVVDNILDEGIYQVKKARFWLEKNTFYLDTLNLNKCFVEIYKINQEYLDAYLDTVSLERIKGRYSGNTIISGKFEIYLVSNSGHKIQITNGRFDLKNQDYTYY